ncbi:MAG: bifunctional phosphopantothenoylcysteine decarboxylase/phosphopantothenate--cysteine ligase CoaBC [Anaerovorax sp.]
MLVGKTVLIGVSGGIASYKTASLVSMLKKQGCQVHVIMTKNGTEFISPLTFEALSGNRCVTHTFDRNYAFDIEHISLAKQADLFMVAPATANILGKMAYGIADDMLTTTMLACTCPKILVPSMNTKMYENPLVQDNIGRLKEFGFTVITPETGDLACGDHGAGKMPEPQELYSYIEQELACIKDLRGKKILITAGPTQEALDPVRYITNHSTGKMGCALAKAAALRGAEVTLVMGQTAGIELPKFVEVVSVISAEDMFQAVAFRAANQDIIIKAAAVADYTPAQVSPGKIKKKDQDLTIALNRTKDILKWLGEHQVPGQFLCGFSMETENVLENSRSKLLKKKVDMIIANSLGEEGGGFAGDTNILTIITKKEEVSLPKMSKLEAAHRVLDAILKAQEEK